MDAFSTTAPSFFRIGAAFPALRGRHTRGTLPRGLRFSAFNQRRTPEISGTVSRVSADVTTEQRTGMTYYTARIAIEPHEIARLGDVKLVPGMPVEAFIKTGDRTVGSYLTKPLFDQVARALRDR